MEWICFKFWKVKRLMGVKEVRQDNDKNNLNP